MDSVQNIKKEVWEWLMNLKNEKLIWRPVEVKNWYWLYTLLNKTLYESTSDVTEPKNNSQWIKNLQDLLESLELPLDNKTPLTKISEKLLAVLWNNYALVAKGEFKIMKNVSNSKTIVRFYLPVKKISLPKADIQNLCIEADGGQFSIEN